MDHAEATRLMATEQYLLHELAPELRDDFEEHLFGCPQCAMDLRSGAAFIQQIKIVLPEFEREMVAAATVPRKQKRRFAWIPAFSMAAIVALLIVVGYQNFVSNPKLRREVAELNTPHILASASLISARDTSVPQLKVGRSAPALIFLDIPMERTFSSYAAEFHDPAGKLLWTLPIASETAKNTVSIQIPPLPAGDGLYNLVLYGLDSNPDSRTEIRQYKFQLKYEN